MGTEFGAWTAEHQYRLAKGPLPTIVCCWWCLCRLLQEQEAWVQLLAQYNSMSAAPAADAAQGPAAAAGATPQQELGGRGTQAAGSDAHQAGATAGNKEFAVVTVLWHSCQVTLCFGKAIRTFFLCHSMRLLQAFSASEALLEADTHCNAACNVRPLSASATSTQLPEATNVHVAAAGAEVAEAPVPEAAADPAAEVAGQGGVAGAELADAPGPVCAEQQDSLLGVQLKVEVLTALVAKMEHLVGRAEATARALQVGGASVQVADGQAVLGCELASSRGGLLCTFWHACLSSGVGRLKASRQLPASRGLQRCLAAFVMHAEIERPFSEAHSDLVEWVLLCQSAAWFNSRPCCAPAAAQAGYRAEKFSVFPHVDSPAMLIKSLAGRGSQATQGGTQAGTKS